MTSRRQIVLTLFVSMSLFGCAKERMAAIPDSQAVITSPPNKAVVVFMASTLHGLPRPSVFDITVEPPLLVGIVPPGTSVAYTTDPGVRRFMVLGDLADFMDATLLPGKTYYVRFSSQIGTWKPKFSFVPVAKTETDQALTGELAYTQSITTTAASLEWAQHNMPSIQAKKARSLPSWLAGSNKPTLNADDGR